MEYDRYQKFRQQTYQMLSRAKDATFEALSYRNSKLLAILCSLAYGLQPFGRGAFRQGSAFPCAYVKRGV